MPDPAPPSDASPCQACGACCAAFRVSFHWLEADERALPELLTERVSTHLLCMRGTWSARPRCIALAGDVGRAVTCTAYARRPSPCREVQAGDAQCTRARAVHGLPPLGTGAAA
ncbi:MAG: YkgJ family cysteine cluster protein [Burkholderiaceae bacterium]